MKIYNVRQWNASSGTVGKVLVYNLYVAGSNTGSAWHRFSLPRFFIPVNGITGHGTVVYNPYMYSEFPYLLLTIYIEIYK